MKQGSNRSRQFAAYAMTMIALLVMLPMVVKMFHTNKMDIYQAAGIDSTLTPIIGLPANSLVNVGDLEALDGLPGIGPVLAARMIEYREAHGNFFLPQDLLYVKGIGEKKMADIMEYLAVHEAIATNTDAME